MSAYSFVLFLCVPGNRKVNRGEFSSLEQAQAEAEKRERAMRNTTVRVDLLNWEQASSAAWRADDESGSQMWRIERLAN
ncbi:MAG: hypothetical protein QM729_21220 [Solirubrobacterales bacterium]